VTGIRVPGPFDGLELVRRLRAHDRTRRKPIIVLSACTLPRDQDAAREAGCSVFLPKPCLPDALSREVRRLLAAVSHSIGASAGRGRNCCVTAGHARQRAWIDVENWRQLAG
jgi:DNA-binding response OmpR family regulator